MRDSILIHNADKMTAAVAPHQIQGRQVHLNIPKPAECFAIFLHEPADTPELQIGDLFDHMILFRDLDKDIRRDPAKLRMMQAAQGLQCDKPFFRNGINRLIIQFKSILRNGCVKILLHLFLV